MERSGRREKKKIFSPSPEDPNSSKDLSPSSQQSIPESREREDGRRIG
jgi:hypothetical protein